MRKSLIAVLILSLSAVAAAGEVYKWVDKDGKTHYGDKPKTQPAESVVNKPGHVPGAPVDPEAEKAAATRKAACDAKNKELERYQAAAVINETDSLGNTREFSPADKQKLIERIKQQAAELCAPAAG